MPTLADEQLPNRRHETTTAQCAALSTASKPSGSKMSALHARLAKGCLDAQPTLTIRPCLSHHEAITK